MTYEQFKLSDGAQVKGSTRQIKIRPEEMMHMMKLIDYSLPAIHGW